MSSSPPLSRPIPWCDDPRPLWSAEVARTFKARVAPPRGDATEIVLEGRCPRCHHDFASTHPIRAVISESKKQELAEQDEATAPDGYELARVTTDCRCSNKHADAPEDRTGCGAPFAVWVSWSPAPEPSLRDRVFSWLSQAPLPVGRERTVEPLVSAGLAEPLALEEERQLRTAAATQLADVRKAAESWKTGLAAFLAILVAVFFVKGKDSFDDIDGAWWKRALAFLLLLAGASALYGAYRALRAAYGTPRDEYLGEVSPFFRRLHPTTPRDISKYGTVSAWHHASARTAVNDLRHAKVATIFAMFAFAAAAAITWFAPGPPVPASAKVTYRVRGGRITTCGKVAESKAGRLKIEPPSGRSHTPSLRAVDSIRIVKSCP